MSIATPPCLLHMKLCAQSRIITSLDGSKPGAPRPHKSQYYGASTEEILEGWDFQQTQTSKQLTPLHTSEVPRHFVGTERKRLTKSDNTESTIIDIKKDNFYIILNFSINGSE